MRGFRHFSALTFGILTLATVALRVPLLTPRLAHWDAVNYALALHEFDVAAHQPHPPGSPFFVLLGRAALVVTGDDNAALQLVSVGASVGAVLAEYSLAQFAFGSRAGVLAAVVLMTQPVFWGYGTIGNAWTLLACLSIVIGVVCLRLSRGQSTLVWPSGLLIGVASGFRLDAAVFLTPLWLWMLWRAAPRRGWQSLLAVGLASAVLLGWLVPVTMGAGGLGDWTDRLLALLPSIDVGSGALPRQLAANTAIEFGTFAFALGPAVVLSLIASHKQAFDWLKSVARSEMAAFWSLWIVPAFVFLWLVDATEPGHNLVFIGALVALGAGVLSCSSASPGRFGFCGSVLVVVQAATFLLAAPQDKRPLAWTMNSMLLNVTAPGFRRQQTSLASALETIEANFDPHSSAVVTLVGQDQYRFLMYYLPEYTVLRLNPDARSVLAARGGKQDNWTAVSDCLFSSVPGVPEVQHAAWVVSTPSEPGLVPRVGDAAVDARRAEPVPGVAGRRGPVNANPSGLPPRGQL